MLWLAWWGLSQAAEIVVPGAQQPLAWARAWAEVVEALQDPRLGQTRIEWTEEPDGGWTLSLQHGLQRARVSGLVPASTHDGRLEQLYVGVSLLGAGRRRGGLDALIAPPTANDTPTVPPPPAVREPGPQAEPAALPPPIQAWTASHPTSMVSFSEIPMAVDGDRSPFLASLLLHPGEGPAGLTGGAVQATWQPSRIGVGVRGGATFTRDVRPDAGVRLEQWRYDLVPMLVARLWSSRHWATTAAAGVGGSVRQLRTTQNQVTLGAIPVARAQLGAEAGGRVRLRGEFALSQDLRAVDVEIRNNEVRLPATRAQFAVGCTIGGRR